MIDSRKVLGLIPARGGSKGIPGKNIKPLCGKPLISWTIETAKDSRYLDDAIVSSDSHEIIDVAKKWGAEAPFVRPARLAKDTTSSSAVILHALEYLEGLGRKYDYFVLLEPTSPLREAEDIDNCIEKLNETRNKADSIVSIYKIEATHPAFDVKINKQGLIESYLPQDNINILRRQDLNELYFFEGTVYCSKVDVYKKRKTFYHERTLPYIVTKDKAFEVDDMTDFVCVEALLRKRLGQS